MLVIRSLVSVMVMLGTVDTVSTSQPSTNPATEASDRPLSAEERKTYEQEIRATRTLVRELHGPLQETLRRNAANVRASHDGAATRTTRNARDRRAEIRSDPFYRNDDRRRRAAIKGTHDKAIASRAEQLEKRDQSLDRYGDLQARASTLERTHLAFLMAEVHARWGQDRLSRASFRSAVSALRQYMVPNPCTPSLRPRYIESAESNMFGAAGQSIRELTEHRLDLVGSLLTDNDSSLRAAVNAEASCLHTRRTGLRRAVATAWAEIEKQKRLASEQPPIAHWWLSQVADGAAGSAYRDAVQRLSQLTLNIEATDEAGGRSGSR